MADRNTADDILLADRKSTRDAWNSARNTELVRRIKAMEEDDLNEWITWLSNVARESGEEQREFIRSLGKGMKKTCAVRLKGS